MSNRFSSKIRPVWLASYPRSGNTFLRIVLQNIFRQTTYSVYRVEGQQAYDPSADALEEAPFLPRQWRNLVSTDSGAALMLIKTHDLPEDTGPAIYVVRDGRATVDSYFHYHQKFAFEQPSLTEIIAGACQFGSWSEHFYAWRPQTRPNTLFLRYEDLVSKPEGAIPVLAKFLRLTPTEGRLPTFDELKSRFPTFFRRGSNQDFLTQWTPGQIWLFNVLHGQAMRELGYDLTPAPEVCANTLTELARSAARLHRMYLQELHKHAATESLRGIAAQLTELTNHVSNVQRNKWVRLGVALGMVEPPGNKPQPKSKAPPTAS